MLLIDRYIDTYIHRYVDISVKLLCGRVYCCFVLFESFFPFCLKGKP